MAQEPHGREIFNTSMTEEMQINAARLLRRIVSNDSADGLGIKKVAKATYDFAVNGGAISAIGLGVTIPAKAVITRAWVDVIQTLTSAGADAGTIALHAEGADDLVAAVAISAATDWDEGIREGIPVDTAATSIKLTVARELTATIAVQVLTAGKFALVVEYVMTE